MEDHYRDHTSLVKGAKDLAKEAKRQAIKKVNKAVDRASDEFSSHSYSRFQDDEDEGDGDEDQYYYRHGQQDGKAPRENEEDEGSSDATEGHDDEDEIYEGEYQGVPATMGDGRRVALGQPVADGAKDRRELEKEREAEEEELAQQYELIIQECGHGRFQWQLFLVLGLALMSDGVEVFVVGFVLPSAETDMCVPNSGAGWLGSIVYLGMMVGAFFWGGLSDKVGRRQCLLVCMSVSGFFAFLSSFVQGYSTFLFCRMLSGFGIGGAVPIVFSFFSEVLAREKRGEHLSWLCMFWMIGGIYASAMAWAIIPHYGWSFSMGSAYQFHSWRVFVVVCALPCVCAVVALTFMPESPRFYLETGKHDEAWMVLKQIHDTNMRARGQPEKVFTVNRIKIPKQLDELVEMQSESAHPASKVLFRIKSELRGIWLTFMRCWDYPVKDNTVKLAIVWFSLSFGYYGLSVWFPDVIKHLQADEYASRVKIHENERIEDFTFNFTLENQIHTNGVFIKDRFISMKFKSVTFKDSTFLNCHFEDVTSVGSFFKNCTFIQVEFYNTGGSMVLSGISCFFLWFGTSESMMIGMLCLYNGLSISAWNSLDVVTVELYPTDRRGTGFGFCNAMCKLAAVLGNLIFGSLVGITKAIPILLASGVLVSGGLVGLRLPDTRSNVLM
ncbi:synaptic vesicle glycoprotein 2C-like isoform X2 [Chanos chanos]|uniref:Synaptic vesicle glycoprotein 2C-like isoform X2 n=1 Tax=Chanos chanos TaxID=29144 RepID=A0A6J2UYV8_CHACN|nr:synaptic vesicle glycoprotein 2C isoform X2 [Chanos chanos]